MTGRGAWNTKGVGGTKAYKDETKPGPYYYLGVGAKPVDRLRTNDEYAVYRAVKAYQEALNRRIGANLVVDGLYGPVTLAAVTKFQTLHVKAVGTVWGGIGPETSRALLISDLRKVANASTNDLIIPKVIAGTVKHESLWDAGAVGVADDRDLGLAQINGAAHPTMTKAQRLDPLVAFKFVVTYYENALSLLDNNLRDAVASYNLGIGGAQRWISQGRPEWYTPEGQSVARDVWKYIDTILAG